MDAVTIFHPAIWNVLVVMILPLIAVIFAIMMYALRQMDSRVLALCKAVARLEGRMSAWPPGMRDQDAAEFLSDYGDEDDKEQR